MAVVSKTARNCWVPTCSLMVLLHHTASYLGLTPQCKPKGLLSLRVSLLHCFVSAFFMNFWEICSSESFVQTGVHCMPRVSGMKQHAQSLQPELPVSSEAYLIPTGSLGFSGGCSHHRESSLSFFPAFLVQNSMFCFPSARGGRSWGRWRDVASVMLFCHSLLCLVFCLVGEAGQGCWPYVMKISFAMR